MGRIRRTSTHVRQRPSGVRITVSRAQTTSFAAKLYLCDDVCAALCPLQLRYIRFPLPDITVVRCGAINERGHMPNPPGRTDLAGHLRYRIQMEPSEMPRGHAHFAPLRAMMKTSRVMSCEFGLDFEQEQI